MRPRGFALLFALASVMAITGAVILLGSALAAQIQARRQAALREAALRCAESALEQACLAVEARGLAAGRTGEFGGLTVSCSALPGGLRLEVLAELAPPRPGAKVSGVRRGVRVAWDLADAGRSGWIRGGWQARDETLVDAPRKPR
jgi:Tfp pilus assembly protein PilX